MNRHTREIHDYVGHKSVKQCCLCSFKTIFILQLYLHFTKELNHIMHRICSYCITAFEDTEFLYSHQEDLHGLPRRINELKNGDKQSTTTQPLMVCSKCIPFCVPVNRTYSEEELNDQLADFNQSDDRQSLASRIPFVDDEAEDVDLESFILSWDDDGIRGSPTTQSSH